MLSQPGAAAAADHQRRPRSEAPGQPAMDL